MYQPGDKQIISIAFTDRWIEVQYAEPTHTTTRVVDTITRLIDPTLVGDDVIDVLDTISDMIDKAAIEKRNPPQTFTAER